MEYRKFSLISLSGCRQYSGCIADVESPPLNQVFNINVLTFLRGIASQIKISNDKFTGRAQVKTLIRVAFLQYIPNQSLKVVIASFFPNDFSMPLISPSRYKLPQLQALPKPLTKLNKARVKRRTSHEPNPIQLVRLMWRSVFDPTDFDWFYLARLRRSARLASRE